MNRRTAIGRLTAAAGLGSLGGLLLWPGRTRAQGRPDSAGIMAAQRAAMGRLAFLDGLWRGTAVAGPAGGPQRQMVQTERVGLALDGTVRVIEGRAHDADGTVLFQSFGIVSFDPSSNSFMLRAHADGQRGDFAFSVEADGYAWEVPSGPGRVRYRARVADGRWRQAGELLLPERPPLEIFRMDLQRIGDTNWPAAGAVPAR
jgi:hypothetical protein